MRCLLALMIIALGFGVRSAAALGEDRVIGRSLLKLEEKPVKGDSELARLMVQRYNACVKSLRMADRLHSGGKMDTFELLDTADELVEAALDLSREPEQHIEIMRMHVEFADYVHHQAIEIRLGQSPSPYLKERTEGRLLAAKVRLLKAQEQLQAGE